MATSATPRMQRYARSICPFWPATSSSPSWRCPWCWSRSSSRSPAAFPQHRKIARWTFPLWLYVSVTGVITYVMLRLAQGSVSGMPVSERIPEPARRPPHPDDGTRQLLQWGRPWWARACFAAILLQTLLGGFSPTGASTNTGWFALIVALMCTPLRRSAADPRHRQVAPQPLQRPPPLSVRSDILFPYWRARKWRSPSTKFFFLAT